MFLFATLVSCAEESRTESGENCNLVGMNAEIEYPDGEERKSDVYLCETNCNFLPVNGEVSQFSGACPAWVFN